MDLFKNKTALAVSVAAAGIVTTAALAMVVWPALVRPEPPMEKAGDNGLRIRVVEPPKAAAEPSSLLDVGLSQAAQALDKGRDALFVRTPPVVPAAPPARPRPSPAQVAQTDLEDDLASNPEPVDDQRDEAAWRRDRFERAQHQRWEDERLARREREQRVAWEQDQRDRERWEETRERDRYDDRYDPPPPPEEDRAPAGRW